MKPAIYTLFALFALFEVGFSQCFINLNFESAQIIPDPNGPFYPYSIAITNALPGWAVYGSTQGDITYNDPATGSAAAVLWAANGKQISGNYSVLLQGGAAPFYYITISQSGLVPVGAESLFFEAQSYSSAPGSLSVSLGGLAISFFAYSTGANYTLYAGSIPSTVTDQVESLQFSVVGALGNENAWNIDNIQFSDTSVPEPGMFSLAAVGGLFFAWRRWRKPLKT